MLQGKYKAKSGLRENNKTESGLQKKILKKYELRGK